MEESSKELGLTTIWMASAFTLGLMGANILASTRMTRNMGTVSIRGLMAAYIAAAGLKANSMVLASTL
jgi:hypothetical protein